MHDLLKKAGILDNAIVQERGAIMSVQINWNCGEYDCSHGVDVTRMDQNEYGYKTERAEYHLDSQGVQTRTRYQASGIKIFAKASGQVFEYSLINIVMQLSSAIGMLLAARSLTDAVMLKVFNEKTHYQNQKFIKTEAAAH